MSALALVLWSVLIVALPATGWAKCTPDMVSVGPVCVDKYEASVWRIPPGNTRLIGKIRRGAVDIGDLQAAGAEQVSPSGSPDQPCQPPYPTTFPASGEWTEPLYVVSVVGVVPTGCTSWFQAEQACRLSGKRLLTNQEWQAAASGTPDALNLPDNPLPECNVDRERAEPTGLSTACVSRWGAADMIGNVAEWVADWVPSGTACPGWPLFAHNDLMCLAGASTTDGPGALVRGGTAASGSAAGSLSVVTSNPQRGDASSLGFRCAR
jgi:formylglycine-generating enzyme required for sulfatase activity